MTFSIAGRCARTGMFGAVVSSSSPAVAARCIFARAGVGAACSQNITDPRLGPQMLDLLAKGRDAKSALDEVVAKAPHIEFRQLCLVDAGGRGAAYSGAKALGRHSTRVGTDCVAAGNLLASDDVPGAMVAAFEARPDSPLGDRLIAALQAAVAAGGETGPVHSCGLVLVDRVPWNVADLRVDWAEDDPVSELAALWEIYRPQLDDYVQRALDPSKAPSYPLK
jgi:uncharacterized Ntn-hydrolase superfamily protein